MGLRSSYCVCILSERQGRRMSPISDGSCSVQVRNRRRTVVHRELLY
jgi:hypothetical protein